MEVKYRLNRHKRKSLNLYVCTHRIIDKHIPTDGYIQPSRYAVRDRLTDKHMWPQDWQIETDRDGQTNKQGKVSCQAARNIPQRDRKE